MSRLHISHHSETLLVLKQDFDGGDLVVAGWVIFTLAVGWVLMLLTGHWGWLMLGVILGIVGFNIVTAITPSSGYRCYRFDRAANCLNIQEIYHSEQIDHEETYALNHIETARVELHKYRDWKGILSSESQALTLVISDRTINLEFVSHHASRDHLETLANVINRFLDES